MLSAAALLALASFAAGTLVAGLALAVHVEGGVGAETAGPLL